jgi:hypothetical protein
VVCWRERQAAIRKVLRKQELGNVARRAAVVACVALSGAAAAGAALMPQAHFVTAQDPHLAIVARGEVSFIADAVQRYSDAHGATCPRSLGELRKDGYLLVAPVDPWGEPLLYGCVESPRAFVVMSKGPDHEVGTDDDLLFTGR